MAYLTDDLLPISALQHLAFCPRQWGLIHLEQVWKENRLTAEGRILHERADNSGVESRNGTRIATGVWLQSARLGITGRADVVEFRPAPYPVEYKRGRAKPDDYDEVQLCAQAICLEEMLGVEVPAGAFFYGQPRRRLEVAFTPELRARTESLAHELHRLHRAGETPAPRVGKHCRSCSLVDVCLPDATGGQRSAAKWLARVVQHRLHADDLEGSAESE